MRRYILTSLAVICGAFPAYAKDIVKQYIPQADVTGEGRFTYVLWDVYDATLYAPNGKWIKDKPHALRLKYLRKLEGEKIAKRSVEEMRKQGFKDEVKLAAWYAEMNKIFPNVREGTELTGIHFPDKETKFYENEKEIGTIKDPAFGEWFFGIWLSENTSDPEFRQELLGQNKQ